MTAQPDNVELLCWLAFDIGCLECGEKSAVVGVFLTRDEAAEANAEARKRQAADWHGEHSFETFPVTLPDKLTPPHNHKGYSEEKCLCCGWVMGLQPLNCMNDDTPHVFPSQVQPSVPCTEMPTP